MIRINYIADLIKPCKRVIDIGSDHAYLAINLLSNQKAEMVCNVEVNQQPLDVGIKNLTKHHLLDKTQNILNDGIKNINSKLDDKSFNQGSWEALETWGKEHGLQKGPNGYNYLESISDSDYVTNLSAAVHAEYDMIFAGGYKLEAALKEVAPSYTDSHFAIIDRIVELPNVASITFKDHESSFLAGVAAGETTKTNKVGFIGGMRSEVIDRFEAGFVAGVHAVNPEAVVEIQYADSFVDAGKGKTMAHAMYSNEIDVIYHAAALIVISMIVEIIPPCK